MENAFSDYNSLEIFFVICAVTGGFFVLVKLFLQFVGVGMATDSGGDVDTPFSADGHHADSDVGFKFLSLHGLSSFFMMFGLIGLALYRQSKAGMFLSLAGAVVAGLFAVWAIGKLFQMAIGLQSSGTLTTADAVGSTGTVYLTIPKGGTGRVNINFSNHLREFDAVAADEGEISTGLPIRVVRVKANILIVETIH
ncbi:MAG: NfeD family protein [Desulfobulbaceae bacterium]